MDDIVIFGAGKTGKCAKIIYEKICNIVCFVDNDRSKWGTTIDGIPVLNPTYISENKNVIVVIAVTNGVDLIRSQIFGELKINKILVFRLDYREEPEYWNEWNNHNRTDEELVVSFMGGLGNQMFQYSMMRYLALTGKEVSADFSWYSIPGKEYHKTMIWDVFDNLMIRYSNPYILTEYKNKGLFFEENADEYGSIKTISRIKKCKRGIWSGYFQIADLVRDINEMLVEEFEFPKVPEIENVIYEWENSVTVSVHIRRGDYLKSINDYLNICDIEYFNKAISKMRELLATEPTFVFFSDDIDWAKKNIRVKKAIYIEKDNFIDYQDWYDMCLMSKCQNHIISNSTFSWWGAWLGYNKNKKVIAPKCWSKRMEMPDICPEDWYRV